MPKNVPNTYIWFHSRDRMYEIYRNNQLYGVASTMSEADDVAQEAREFTRGG